MPTGYTSLQAVSAGADVLYGGARLPDTDAEASGRKPGVGYYVSPTVLSGVHDGDEAWNDEIFGPVRADGNEHSCQGLGGG